MNISIVIKKMVCGVMEEVELGIVSSHLDHFDNLVLVVEE